MHPLETYLSALYDARLGGGVAETSGYAALANPTRASFSTNHNREGIQVGTAIALFARKEAHEPAPAVHFRHLWGKTKRAQLTQTAQQDGAALYEEVAPPLELGLPFVPGESSVDYFTRPSLLRLLCGLETSGWESPWRTTSTSAGWSDFVKSRRLSGS